MDKGENGEKEVPRTHAGLRHDWRILERHSCHSPSRLNLAPKQNAPTTKIDRIVWLMPRQYMTRDRTEHRGQMISETNLW